MNLLVFPLDLIEVDTYIEVSKALGIGVVGASSEMDGPGEKNVDHFTRLPFITEPGFDEALRKIIAQYAISNIYAPHQGVWRHLERLLEKFPATYRFKLCKPDPFTATKQQFQPHESWAARASSSTFPLGLAASASVRSALPESCYAALHRQFFTIPGQCDVAKLQALCDIARVVPQGDFLEIGSLYGRSAFALGYLANRHKLGGLICVDPWNSAELTDQGPQAAVLNTELANASFDDESIFRMFLTSLALLDNVGYIRKTSANARQDYEAALARGYLESPKLGTITLSGQLSLLHIDGNHRYDHVWTDVRTWSPYLAPGGWLLLDDYLWAFGDGPRRVGNELLNDGGYDSAFVSGDTLFLRRSTVD